MSTNLDNSLRIWSLTREDEKYHVSHTDEITCFVITADSLHVITGSRDMSLKVWQATGGKLAQVKMSRIVMTKDRNNFFTNEILVMMLIGFGGTLRRSFNCRRICYE